MWMSLSLSLDLSVSVFCRLSLVLIFAQVMKVMGDVRNEQEKNKKKMMKQRNNQLKECNASRK